MTLEEMRAAYRDEHKLPPEPTQVVVPCSLVAALRRHEELAKLRRIPAQYDLGEPVG